MFYNNIPSYGAFKNFAKFRHILIKILTYNLSELNWTVGYVTSSDELKPNFLNLLNYNAFKLYFLNDLKKNTWGKAARSHLLAIMDVSSPGSSCGVSGGSVSSLSFK